MSTAIETFQAALKITDHNGRESWQLTNDVAKVSAAADEDILWVDNMDALRTELAARHPAPHPRLTCLDESYNGIAILKSPRYDAGGDSGGEKQPLDAEEVYRLARLFGKIEVNDRGNYETNKKLMQHPQIAKECRVWGQYWQSFVEYNPKLVKKRAEAKAEKKAKQAITTSEILAVCHATVKQVYPHIEIKSCSAATPLKDAVRITMQRLAVFNMLYGKKAHRKWPAFQVLAKAWKERSHNNGDKFTGDPILEKFAAWMDKEAKTRLPTPIPARLSYQLDPANDKWTVLDMTVPI